MFVQGRRSTAIDLVSSKIVFKTDIIDVDKTSELCCSSCFIPVLLSNFHSAAGLNESRISCQPDGPFKCLFLNQEVSITEMLLGPESPEC